MIASCTSSGRMRARSTTALIATAPRSLAVNDAKSPCIPPSGVRAAPTMTIGSFNIRCSFARGRASRGPRQLEIDRVRDSALLDRCWKCAGFARFRIEVDRGHPAPVAAHEFRRETDLREELPGRFVELADVPHDVHMAHVIAVPGINGAAIGVDKS